jgi:hypothetical protein
MGLLIQGLEGLGVGKGHEIGEIGSGIDIFELL